MTWVTSNTQGNEMEEEDIMAIPKVKWFRNTPAQIATYVNLFLQKAWEQGFEAGVIEFTKVNEATMQVSIRTRKVDLPEVPKQKSIFITATDQNWKGENGFNHPVICFNEIAYYCGVVAAYPTGPTA